MTVGLSDDASKKTNGVKTNGTTNKTENGEEDPLSSISTTVFATRGSKKGKKK